MLLVSACKVERDGLRSRDRCIVRTDRGSEVGTLLSTPEEISREDFEARKAKEKGKIFSVLRKVSEQDEENARKIDEENRVRAMRYCKEEIKKADLEMKLVEVDYLFGGERIIFYFTAQARVDFRELVRALAREFRTRVELRQIGGRDEARLVGDVGHCGLSLCCRGFIKELGGITMDMAKVQKHTTDPSKITGRCGKLLCCLRYEYREYKEAKSMLPPRGTMLQTRHGSGPVLSQNLLLREVTIEVEAGKRQVVKLDEIDGVADDRVAGCDGCSKPKGGSESKEEVGRPVASAEPEAPPVEEKKPEPREPEPPRPQGPQGAPRAEGEGAERPPRRRRRRRGGGGRGNRGPGNGPRS